MSGSVTNIKVNGTVDYQLRSVVNDKIFSMNITYQVPIVLW